jgi:Rad3-related DNA helicase
MSKPDIESYFPFQNIRDSQKSALQEIKKTFIEEDKKFFILDAETGIGKSAIAVAAAKFLAEQDLNSDKKKGAYFLTTQIILQKQYEDDFGKKQGMLAIKSAANYSCYKNKNEDCATGLQKARLGGGDGCKSNCRYVENKKLFIESELGVTNFSYFLAETQYGGKLEKKRVLILDEAHNLASELSKFIEVTVSERFATSVLKLEFPAKATQLQAMKWISETYLPHAKNRLATLKNDIKMILGSMDKLASFQAIANQVEMLEKHIGKLTNFLQIYEVDNWVYSFIPGEGRNLSKFEFKPIDVSQFAKTMVFDRADKVILMSATIISKNNFIKLLGIEEGETGYLKLDSPFPLENRPVIFSGVGSMSLGSIETSMPKLKQAIEMILAEHPNEKGIIHAQNYKIANYIKQNIKSSRILIHDSSNRNEVLQKHISSKEPTVLLSPSMQEGVDLKDDLSRFQILCKVPFPYLGDKLVKKKMNKWDWWYDYETAKIVIQSIGRSIRNEKDFAISYILDSDWERFLRKNAGLLPKNLTKNKD